MQKSYPIAPSLAHLAPALKARSDQLQFNRLGPPALGIILNVEADFRAFVQLRNSRLLYGCNMDKNILAAPVGSNKTIPLGLIEKLYRAIPAHEKKAPTLITVRSKYASRRVLQQGGSEGGLSLDFCQPFLQAHIANCLFGEAQLNKRAVLVLGSVFCATSFIGESALCKPDQTTKYTYYTISGNTPGAIYSTLVKRGPRVGGVKAYAATTAVSSQSGQLIQGKYCSLEDYRFKIDFTIKLPKLKNEAALKGATRTDWKKFSSFLKIHEETHRSIWLACACRTGNQGQGHTGQLPARI